MAIRILLVDDHTLVRAGLLVLLRAEEDFAVVGETGSGEEALRLARDLQPEIALVDIVMPGITGLQLLGALRDCCAQTRVIMVSVHTSEEHVVRALRAGASGYVYKSAVPQELISAVRAVRAGETWLPSQVSRDVLDAYMRRIQLTDPPNVLTPRQREILGMIANGSSTKRIAGDLGVSVKTVESHRAQIMGKLDIRDTAGLVRYAIRHGIAGL